MHPISCLIAKEPSVRITEQHIFSEFIKAQLIKMFIQVPFPDNIPLPIYLKDGIIKKLLVGDFRIIHVFMYQNERIPFRCFRLCSRCVITYRISFALIVMMCSCHPHRLMTGVLNKLMPIESPYNVSIPIDLNEINLILKTVLWITLCSTSKDIPTR
ncbi:hypothetical protein D3C73_787480 [compost metagenome]